MSEQGLSPARKLYLQQRKREQITVHILRIALLLLLLGLWELAGRKGWVDVFIVSSPGRVIRTLADRGVIALLDERFLRPDYRRLFPREWSDVRMLRTEEIGPAIREFWKKQGRYESEE